MKIIFSWLIGNTAYLRLNSLFLLISFLIGHFEIAAQNTIVNYSYDGSNFCNPERGFYIYSQSSNNSYPISTSLLSSYRASGYSLLFRVYYISNNSALSSSFFSQFDNDMQIIRSSGMKCVLLFAYTSTDSIDAPVDTVLSHLDQLAPHLQSNYDVIAVLQMGFIGQYGEGYYTSNFGNEGNITTTDWNNRAAVLMKELTIMPKDRMVAVRYPWHKTVLLNRTTPITAAEAYNGSNWSRTGYYDDAFMANAYDWGTFRIGSTDKAFLAAESTYLVSGGEAEYGDSTINGCSNTTTQITNFHMSYLNVGYNLNTIDKWVTEGCFPDIQKKFGYRFYLNNAAYTSQVQPGGTFNININLTNEGYAAPYNPRLVEVVLENLSDGKVCKAQLNVDPRFWLPGSNNLNQNIGIPSNYPSGNYKVYLNLPDPVSSLYDNPYYSIRMANTGTWDSIAGYNDLGFTLVVNNNASTTAYSGSQWFNTSCYGSLPVDLISFQGEFINGTANLKWTTVSEKNNQYFIVQRSFDGKSFQDVGKVTGMNNSKPLSIYNYTDTSIQAASVFYRLVVVDVNGNAQISNVINLPSSITESNVYLSPNPSNNYLNVKITDNSGTNYHVEIYNSLGESVYSDDGKIVGNFDEKPVDISTIKGGIYFVYITTSDNLWIKKLVKN